MTENNLAPIRIERYHDIEVVSQFIDSSEYFCILNIYSISGLGKSELFQKIIDKYNKDRPTALVKAANYIPEGPKKPYKLNELLIDIIKKLNPENSSDENLSIQELTDKIYKEIESFNKRNKTPIIIIDNYEKMPNGSRDNFEGLVLVELSRPTRQAIFILGSVQKLDFSDRLDIRGRVRAYPLSPLKEDDIFSDENRNDEIIQYFLKWTGGMPALFEYLVNKARPMTTVSNDYQRQYQSLLEGPEYHLKILSTAFPDIPLSMGEFLDTLGLLRRFDVTLLYRIMPRIDPNTFRDYKQKQYLDLIQALSSRAQWRDQGGYELVETLRDLISSYVRAFNPDKYKEVNQKVVNTYENLLSYDFRPHYIIELLFHRLCIKKIEPMADDDQITEQISNELMDQITDYIRDRKLESEDIDYLVEIENSLRNDKDLISFIYPDVLERIGVIIKNHT